MASNRLEATSAEAEVEEPTAPSPPRNEPGAGGLKTWLPLIANVILMPILAYGMTAFVLLPKLRQSPGQRNAAQSEIAGKTTPSEHGSKEPTAKSKFTVNLS